MMAEETPRWKVAAVVLFYMAVALVMVMVNKWVLTSSSLPLTFLFLQLAISVLCLNALSFLPANHPFVFHPPRWTLAILTSMAPVCIANVTGLVFNIYCLKLVDASYFQVARGLTLPMTVVLQSLSTGEKPTMGTIASCGLVTWGFTYSFLPIPVTFLDTTVPELVIEEVGRSVEAPMLGMIFGVASAAMIAIHAVLVKVAIKKVEGKTMDLAYWQNALSAIALVPAILISGEVPVFLRTMWGDEGSFSAFAIGSGVTGIVGFLICVAGLLSIKVTSPVTHMFSSAVRSVLQTILGVNLFGDVLNANRIVSIFLILMGSTLYTWFKSRSGPTPPQAPSSTEKVSTPDLADVDIEKGFPQAKFDRQTRR